MTDLTTVANVQAFLGLPAGQDAPLLQSLVTAASTMALTVMNRNSLLTATYT